MYIYTVYKKIFMFAVNCIVYHQRNKKSLSTMTSLAPHYDWMPRSSTYFDLNYDWLIYT